MNSRNEVGRGSDRKARAQGFGFNTQLDNVTSLLTDFRGFVTIFFISLKFSGTRLSPRQQGTMLP